MVFDTDTSCVWILLLLLVDAKLTIPHIEAAGSNVYKFNSKDILLLHSLLQKIGLSDKFLQGHPQWFLVEIILNVFLSYNMQCL